MLLFEPLAPIPSTTTSMTHPDRPKTAPKTSEALDTALDLTVEGLEAAKETIVNALSAPGLGVALNVVIGILKKVQVCSFPVLLCTEC